MRAVLGWLRQRARRRGVAGGRGGAVAIVQRFGSALNLNVHVHALVLDGVYTVDRRGRLRFWRTRRIAARRWGDAIDLPEAPASGLWRARHGRFDFHWAWGPTLERPLAPRLRSSQGPQALCTQAW